MDTPEHPSEPRGALPDAEIADKIYLIKRVPTLRATYQVRMLLFLARQKGQKLVLRVPGTCQFDDALQELLQQRPEAVEREDLA